MKTIRLAVGDKLKVLVDRPLGAGFAKGEIVEVVNFEGPSVDYAPRLRGGVMAPGFAFYVDPTKWPHHYKKVSR